MNDGSLIYDVRTKDHHVLWLYGITQLMIQPQVEHSACPVVAGRKWIATQWYRSHGEKSQPTRLRPWDICSRGMCIPGIASGQ